MRIIAKHILHVYIRGIRLRAETVVADVYVGIRDAQTVDVEGVEAVGVLGEVFVGGVRGDADVVEGDVEGAHEEGRPAGGIEEVDTAYFDVGGIIGEEEDGAVVDVLFVLVGGVSVRTHSLEVLEPTKISLPAKPSYQACPFPFIVPLPKILMSLPPHTQNEILF